MDQLMQANLQIIELLGAVFEEVERHGTHAGARRPEAPRTRAWVGRPRRSRDVEATSRENAIN